MIVKGNYKPTLTEAILYVIEQRLADINTGLPGSITKFDEVTGLANVQLEVDQLYDDGEALTIPPLVNVPVQRVRSNGGNTYFIIPIKPGDKGWIKFSQRTIDNWIQDGKQQNMNSLRMFDLSDAVFEPGLYPIDNQPVDGNEDLVIRHEDSRHIIKTDAHDINTGSGAFLHLTGDKMALGNATGELLTLFNDLLTQLSVSFGVSPVGPAPLDPASVAKIAEIQTALGTMME